MALCRGLLHNHTENSIRDSAMKPRELVQRAREMGAAAVALTDHGVLSGFFEFMEACNGKPGEDGTYIVPPIKGIPGVEAYFIPDRDKQEITTKRQHLLLLARDAAGFKAISKAVTESNALMDNRGFPRMDYTMLEKHFGPGSRGHGHVIATSACLNGVLAQILWSDEDAHSRIERLRKKQADYHPVDDEYLDKCRRQDMLRQQIQSLTEERDRLQALAKVNISAMQKKLNGMEAKVGVTEETRAYARTIPDPGEHAAAKRRLADVKPELSAAKRSLTLLNSLLKDMEAQVDKWDALQKQIQEIKASVRSETAMYEDAKAVARRFSSIFGPGHFFIEVQYHGIEKEAKCMPVLVRLARELELPLVACNDAHYARPEDAHAREIVAALRFNTLITEDKEPGYDQLYLKDDEEQRAALLEILDEAAVRDAMQGISTIVEMCDFKEERGTHYPRFKGGEPEEGTRDRLRRLAEAGVSWRYPDPGEWTEGHRQRMEYELDIIDRAGYNDYLCIVQDDLSYGRKLAMDNEDGVGYGVGPGRGSAVGSLVCYLTGITSVDPVKYGLLFERFLSLERVSQPDIDSDFHTQLRALVLENVKRKHGEGAVAQILTKGTMAARGAVRNVGRVTGVPLATVDKVARMIPGGPKVTLERLPDDLQRLYDTDTVVRQLIDDARLVEGAAINFGTHAAGVIISDNEDISDYVPLMYMPDKDRWAVQCDMVEAEKLGLLKMDFLGLNNLDIIDDTLHRVYRNHGLRIDIEKIPLDDPDVFEQIFAAGRTRSVFQFESPGMREMLRKFRPTDMKDIILLVAAYRPGPMQYLDSIISVKHGKSKPAYIVPQLEPILRETYGKPVYQESVMMIFNKVAGFSLGEADIIRRAMSKKKHSILTDPGKNYKGRFIDGLISHGASAQEAETFWEELLEFANYAFNKSHAAAYAKVSYMTAYLKHHYPAEYMCSVMARTTHEKLPMLLAESQNLGLDVRGPDVNTSHAHFINIGNTLSFGLCDVKNVGGSGAAIVEERLKNGSYKSFKDFLLRLFDSEDDRALLDKGAAESIICSGALDLFSGGNREALLAGYASLVDDIKKRRDKRLERERMLEDIENPELEEKEKKSLQRKINNRNIAVETLDNTIQSAAIFTASAENRREKLEREKQLLGFYVSGHPLDDYIPEIVKEKATDIAEITEGPVKVCGMIADLKVRARKSDGKPLAFFKLVDRTGEIEIKCWTSPYARYRHIIAEDAVVVITGKMRCTREMDDEGQEVIVDSGITIDSMKELKLPESTQAMVSIRFITDWLDSVQEQVKEYQAGEGLELLVYDETLDQLRTAEFRVSPDILSARILGATVSKV